MEFNEKLQELRKKKGLTQDELAKLLFVSRTAISKWESGRGYPNIDSLKAISEFFGVSVDSLLSGNELLTIAKADTVQKEKHFLDLLFGSLDCSAAMLFFIPLFGQRSNLEVDQVSLLHLTDVAPYLKVGYFAVVILLVVFGILTLAMQNCTCRLWVTVKRKLSLVLNALGVLVFTASLQPYAAVLLFVFLSIKVMMLIKRQ